MLKVRACAALMGGFFGPKFSKQGYLFSLKFSLNIGGFPSNWQKIIRNG